MSLEIQEGTPPVAGLYVAYVNHEMTNRHAGRELLMWISGKWSRPLSAYDYRGHVYDWIGPLPGMDLTD